MKQKKLLEPINHIYCGDAIEILKTLSDCSVDCGVTSPPYFGLRDYGVDGQIGLEETTDLYISKLVKIFREFRRVLKPEGTLWVNIGDSYVGTGGDRKSDVKTKIFNMQQSNNPRQGRYARNQKLKENKLKPKDLIGIPWMLAFALREDGWYLRQDIIWSKPNPMPESVKDRCTKAHEYIFLLSKSPHYYYDYEAIKEPTVYQIGSREDKKRGEFKGKYHAHQEFKHISDSFRAIRDYRNKRDVWTVPTKPYQGAHFATFPDDLIEPCILAGCPQGGVVLDMFMGSGTTGLVALKNFRNYIGIEINKDYIEISERRLQPYKTQINMFSINYDKEEVWEHQ